MNFKGINELYHVENLCFITKKKRNFFSGLLIIIIFIIIGYNIIKNKVPNEEYYWLIGSFILGTGVSIGLVVMFFTYHEKRIYTGQKSIVYYVTIDDDVTLKDFYENFDVINKSGDLWIISKKEEKE